MSRSASEGHRALPPPILTTRGATSGLRAARRLGRIRSLPASSARRAGCRDVVMRRSIGQTHATTSCAAALARARLQTHQKVQPSVPLELLCSKDLPVLTLSLRTRRRLEISRFLRPRSPRRSLGASQTCFSAGGGVEFRLGFGGGADTSRESRENTRLLGAPFFLRAPFSTRTNFT